MSKPERHDMQIKLLTVGNSGEWNGGLPPALVSLTRESRGSVGGRCSVPRWWRCVPWVSTRGGVHGVGCSLATGAVAVVA